ncbi:MAG: hypothetical protein ACD_63C00242G0004 [uncultured bacterium]|nr:MAG: hypothetical protein ACD_63C00242G0004 [uncultured bacterium]
MEPGPVGLKVSKIPKLQKKTGGDVAAFEVAIGNTGNAASQVFFYDSWVKNQFDDYIDKVLVGVEGSNPIELANPKENYMDCEGTVELAACYVDSDRDGKGDTILVYTETLPSSPVRDFIKLELYLSKNIPTAIYKNEVGLTSKEMNPQDPKYPNSFGVEGWNWVTDAGSVNVSGSLTQVPGLGQNYDLWVNKYVDHGSANPGDRLGYETLAGNKGGVEATNILFMDSLLFKGEASVAGLKNALKGIGTNPSTEELKKALQSAFGASNGNNLPEDNYVTGLDVPTLEDGVDILDVDDDKINDTAVYFKNAAWEGRNSGLIGANAVGHAYAFVKSGLPIGNYKITNYGIVVKSFSSEGGVIKDPEVFYDDASTVVDVAEQPPTVFAKLEVRKVVTDSNETNVTSNTASAGETLDYTITFKNVGTGAAVSSFIEDDYAEEFLTITDAGGAIDSGNTLLWLIGDLPAGATETRSFKAKINSDMPPRDTTFTNVAMGGAIELNHVYSTVATKVPQTTSSGKKPYITSSKSIRDDNGGKLEAGDLLTYTLTLKNKGNEKAVNVEVIDDLPSTVEKLQIISIPKGATDSSTKTKLQVKGFEVAVDETVQVVYKVSVKSGLKSGTEVANKLKVASADETGKAAGTTTAGSTGKVGSAFTGEGTGKVAAALDEAELKETAAKTGTNSLLISVVAIVSAVITGFVTIVIRKRSFV